MSLLHTLIPALNRTPAPAPADQHRPADLGPTVKPAYEVKETPEAFGVTVYLPGVAKEGLDLTAEENAIRIVGRRAWKQPEGWTSLYRESADVPFELILAHDNTVVPDRIAAELRDGVLRISLPKQEAVKPRKIAIN
jgi:HSP20 family molecular chaperone IbpA